MVSVISPAITTALGLADTTLVLDVRIDVLLSYLSDFSADSVSVIVGEIRNYLFTVWNARG
jgi:hypothetical protein